MGLIEQEIKELRELAKLALAGSISAEQAQVQIGFFNQTSKRISHMIQIAAIAAKDTKMSKVYKQMVDANVISGGEAIEVPALNILVKCPEQGMALISREQCLDFSGEEVHIDACQKCQQFTITRKALIP